MNTNVLLKKKEALVKEEAELDTKIRNAESTIKCQELCKENISNFLKDYNNIVSSSKTVSEELLNTLHATDKNSNNYKPGKYKFNK